MDEVLRSLGLQELIEKFNENLIDEDVCLLLGDPELKELIPKVGQRLKVKKYIEHIKKLREEVEITKSPDLFAVLSDEAISGTSTPTSVPGTSPADRVGTATNLTPHEEVAEDSNTKSIDGRAILKDGERGGGLLKEGSRRKLSQLVIHHILEKKPSGKITTEEFYKLATQIVEIFTKESVVLYYSAYVAGTGESKKKNASGKLYESYITRRRKLRQSGELQGSSRASSNASSLSMPTTATDDDTDGIAVEQSTNENLTWLNNNVDPWITVEKKWTDTCDYRLKQIYDSGTITEYFNKYPALKQPQGYTLLLNDFNQTYPGKENKLFSTLSAKQEDILAYAKGKAEHSRNNTFRTEILKLIGMISDDDSETTKNVCLMLLAYVINVSPARKRKGAAALKFSRAEICDGFIKQVSSEAHVTSYIIEKREQLTKEKRTLQPFVIFVGNSVSNVSAAYVVVNETLYRFEKLVTAIDCIFKIYQSTGACYPEECNDLWVFIQIGFYNIRTPFDRRSQVVITLLTDLGLSCD